MHITCVNCEGVSLYELDMINKFSQKKKDMINKLITLFSSLYYPPKIINKYLATR